MSAAALPQNEQQRLQKLLSYNILDTPTDRAFDELAELASDICEVPIALVSLVDYKRQWFKSVVGFGMKETPREQAFCAHTILGDQMLEVKDARSDTRFEDNAMVLGEPNVRFYAGVPLATPDGYNLGTLCVIDRTPRSLTDKQRKALKVLGKQVVKQLELSRSIREIGQMRENLNIQDQLMKDAGEIARLGGWEVDLVTNKPKWSDETYKIHGIEIGSEVEVENSLQCYPGEARQRISEAVARLAEDGTTFDMELPFVDVDGNQKWVRATGRRESQDGKPVRIFGIFQEITKQKNREEALKSKNEQLIQVNNELDSFTYSVSHDLRAPIVSVLGLIDLMKVEDDPNMMSELLGLQEKSMHKMDSFINEILDHSRNTRLSLEIMLIYLKPFVEEVLESFKGQRPSIARIVDINKSMFVYSDPFRLKIILHNLISNSLKYANHYQENPFVRISATKESERTYLAVEDNGIGIKQEYHSKVFDMFFKGHEGSMGSGLGLYIVSGAVEKLNGGINLKSEPNKGTEVTFWMPDRQDGEL